MKILVVTLYLLLIIHQTCGAPNRSHPQKQSKTTTTAQKDSKKITTTANSAQKDSKKITPCGAGAQKDPKKTSPCGAGAQHGTKTTASSRSVEKRNQKNTTSSGVRCKDQKLNTFQKIFIKDACQERCGQLLLCHILLNARSYDDCVEECRRKESERIAADGADVWGLYR
ncbi:hypothetical protein M514_03926 [Trichuris suis]|uniref:Uncharacterized protein n=1 Tax=Trichuris suis TaxID=68888 RepID=A0A085N8X3_9BILA|nr:hypothetical protein M513_03926 [Trichuris suis]KFD65919.1 hypothetical protein M514_03926 [Trichuris suis]